METAMGKHDRGFKDKMGAAIVVCVLLGTMLLAGCSSTTTKAEGKTEGDAAAGLTYMKSNCTTCHSVPSKSAIKPYDAKGAREFLANHMIGSGETDVDNMMAYFFPSN